jgi:Flp pilus assembly protein TadG
MALRNLINRLRAHLRAFRTANGGNVMLTFALATVPIVGLVGGAVDYSRANSDKAAMQAAIDATGLMLSKTASKLTSDDLKTKATQFFNAQFHRTDVNNIVVTPTYTTTNGYQIVLTASGTVPTTFTKVIGINTVNIQVTSTVNWANTRLRVALVLDNTGSMSSSNKLTTMQTATNNLLTQLHNAAAQDGDVYVSIIPFVKDVSVDPVSNNTQTWIDWGSPPANVNVPGTGWGWEGDPPLLASNDVRRASNIDNWMQVGPNSNCPFTSNGYGFTCMDRPATTSGASTVSKVPNSGNYKGYICPSMDNGNKNALKADIYYNGCYDSSKYSSGPSSSASCTDAQGVVHKNCSCSGNGSNKVCATNANYYEHVWRPSVTAPGQVTAAPAHSTWNGCITDRGDTAAFNASNYDTNVLPPVVGTPASLFPAEQYDSCPKTMMPLSYNWTSMTTLVNSMVANGNTNQAIGLAHGWMSLVGGGPFPPPPPEDPLYQYKKVIILLTDGLNTEDRWYTDQGSIDAREQLTCNNIYAAGITLYTVQVNTGGDPTSTLLQNCAGTPNTDPAKALYPDPSKFFLLTSSSEIITTFNQIGTALSNLRVAK